MAAPTFFRAGPCGPCQRETPNPRAPASGYTCIDWAGEPPETLPIRGSSPYLGRLE